MAVHTAWYFACFISTLVLTYISQLSLRRWPDHHHHHHRYHGDNESASAADQPRDRQQQQHANTGTV